MKNRESTPDTNTGYRKCAGKLMEWNSEMNKDVLKS